MSNTLKISVITPVFNGEETIKQTITSVLTQDIPNLEYIIVDGASTDKTLSIIRAYQDPRIQLISEPDKGIYDAMNKGIQQASGDIIAIINADDYYPKNVLQAVIKNFSENTTIDIVYGNLKKIRLHNGQLFEQTVIPNLDQMKQTMSIFHPATFVRKSVYDELGMYNTNYKLAADYDFLLNAYLNSKNFYYTNHVLACFRIGGVSNLSCLSYEEAVKILNSYQLSAQKQHMQKLLKKCRRKMCFKKIIMRVMRILKAEKIYNYYIQKKWQ